MPDLCIIHTNDLHNRFDASCAEIISRAKAELKAVVLDAGDAVWAGNVYYRPGGEPVLGLMSDAGYDAMCIGNREFHFTETGFKSKLSRSTYPILCSNLRSAKGSLLPCEPYLILDKHGLRVGIFGVTVAMVSPSTRVSGLSAFVFDPPIDSAVRVSKGLRDKCDVLIALNHIGLPQDRVLAEAAPWIDLIVGGHSHDEMESPETVNGVPIVQAGFYAHCYGLVEMTRSGGRWDVEGRLLPLKTKRGGR